MNQEYGWILRTREYKGCAIRGASYQVAPGSWAPEACISQYTRDGWKQLWVQSFGHLFGPQGLTFPSRTDADNYAFRLAHTLIDRIQPELQEPAAKSLLPFARRLPKTLKTGRRFPALRRIFRNFKHRV